MEELSKTEFVETRVEEAMEKEARQEMIDYYAALSADAARREQRALWQVRRRQLAAQRAQMLQQDEAALLQELEENPIYEPTDVTSSAPQVRVGGGRGRMWALSVMT